ncbi:hypothetical protein GW17_00039811 [Ensete ventricosum]|nr:hypothetical protein GW17_00039811 [Ensete ventricosum]
MQAAAALCGRQPPCQGAATLATGAAAPAGGRAGRSRSCPRATATPVGDRPLQGGLGCSPPPLAGGLAAADRPCKGAGHGLARLSLARASFATKTQQEHVERFYTIQSHHTQFNTNLSHKNLGSDTIVGKPTVGASHAGREENRRWRLKL